MSYEKLKSLIESLNVDNIKSDLNVVPEQKGDDIVKVMCFSDNKDYSISLAKGMAQYFGYEHGIKSEVKLTTPQEFFRPTKPQHYFHYIELDKNDLLELCTKFNVSYEDIKEECRLKINNYRLKNK